MTRSRHRSSKYNRSRRPRSLSQKQYRKYVGWGGGGGVNMEDVLVG
jgi:hypothetical protein